MASNRQAGYSLVEFIIGSLLSSLLLVSLLQLYHAVQSSWGRIDTQADFSQRERFITRYWRLQWRGARGAQLHGFDRVAPRYWARQRLAQSPLLLVERCSSLPCQTTAWYLGRARRNDIFGHRIWGLYQKQYGHHRLELVDGVESLELRYAVQGSGAGHWETAARVRDWSRVRCVHVRLLLRSFTRKAAPRVAPLSSATLAAGYAHQSWVMVACLPKQSIDQAKANRLS